jgi:hypothetical protein
MAKIVIAELDIDINALLKSTSDLKKEIDALKNTQKDLAASGDKTSEAFVQNEAVLKSLNSAYSSNIKVIQESGQATKTQADQANLLTMALETEVTSIAEARQQNQLLNKMRNETNVTTKEGQAQLTALNNKLNSNNDFIKENADNYLKQKINIGNYSESIKEAAQSMNPLNGGLSGFSQRAQEAGGVLPLVKTGLTGVISGIGGMISASLAFIATPIGAIIAAIAVVLGTLVMVFKTFQPVVDKVEQAVAAFGAVLNVIKNTVLAVVNGTKSLGDAFSGLGSSMSSAATETANLTKAQQDLDDVLQAQEVTTARNRAEINKLNVQLKDRTKTEKERLAISDQIIKKEQADFEQRKKIVDEEVRIARGQIAVKAQFTAAERKLLKEQGIGVKELAESRGGNYDKEFEALNKARLKAIALENEVSVNIEKQYTKRNKIEDDAAAKAERAASQAQAAQDKARAAQEKAAQDAAARRQKEIDDLITKSNIQIELFKTTEGAKQKTALETADFNKQLFEKENADLQLQFDKGKISKEQFELEKLQLSQNYAKQQADTLLKFANAELNLFLETNKSKLIGAQILTDELVAEEQRRLELIEQKRIDNLAKEKGVDAEKVAAKIANNEQLTVAELEFETERIRIASETDNTIQANKKTLEDQIKQRKLEQLAIDNELELAAAQTKLEEDAIKAEQDYQAEIGRFTKLLTDKKITQDQFDAFKKSADDKKAELDTQREISKVQQTLKGMNDIAGAVGSLFGQSKELAIVQAGINGAMAVTSILAQYPKFDGGFAMTAALIGAGAATVAQVAKITSAKTPATPKFEKGGIQEIGGKRHSAGGTKFWGEDGTTFEAEAGEGIGILNRRAFSSFMDFNNANGGGVSTGGFFQGGGIITQGVRPETLNIDSVVEAITSIPAPRVAVEEIQTVGNRYAQVINGANL